MSTKQKVLNITSPVAIRQAGYTNDKGFKPYKLRLLPPMADEGSTKTQYETTMDWVKELPAELFAVKKSQSEKPERRGKILFKYLTINYAGQKEDWTDYAPKALSEDMPVETIKEKMVNFFEYKAENGELRFPDIKVSFEIEIKGNFLKVLASDGLYAIFDRENPKWTANDGMPNYYIITGTVLDVELTLAVKQGNPYFQIKLSTDKASTDIFRLKSQQQTKVFGEDNNMDVDTMFESTDVPDLNSDEDDLWL